MDKFSYGLGMGIGQNLQSMGIKNMSVEDFMKGISDVLAGGKTEMSHAEAQKVVNEHFRALAEEAYAQNKARPQRAFFRFFLRLHRGLLYPFLASLLSRQGLKVFPQ